MHARCTDESYYLLLVFVYVVALHFRKILVYLKSLKVVNRLKHAFYKSWYARGRMRVARPIKVMFMVRIRQDESADDRFAKDNVCMARVL